MARKPTVSGRRFVSLFSYGFYHQPRQINRFNYIISLYSNVELRCVNYTAKIQLSIIHGMVHELSMLSETHIACVGMLPRDSPQQIMNETYLCRETYRLGMFCNRKYIFFIFIVFANVIDFFSNWIYEKKKTHPCEKLKTYKSS